MGLLEMPPLWWYARATGSQRYGRPLYMVKVFLTTGETLPSIVFSASLHWLMFSAPQLGISELPAPCWEWSTFKWRPFQRTTLVVFSELVSPCFWVSSQLHRLADTLSSLRWYAITDRSMLRRNQLADGGSVTEYSFVWLPPLLFHSHVPSLFHENWVTKSMPAETHAGERH
jgi:hypothetical protein